MVVIARHILARRAIFICRLRRRRPFMFQRRKSELSVRCYACFLKLDTQPTSTILWRFLSEIMFWLLHGDPDFFTLNHFQSWKELADSIRNIQGVVEVISVADAVNFVKETESK